MKFIRSALFGRKRETGKGVKEMRQGTRNIRKIVYKVEDRKYKQIYNGKVEVIVELVGIAFASLGSTVFSSTETLSESTEPSSDRKVKL